MTIDHFQRNSVGGLRSSLSFQQQTESITQLNKIIWESIHAIYKKYKEAEKRPTSVFLLRVIKRKEPLIEIKCPLVELLSVPSTNLKVSCFVIFIILYFIRNINSFTLLPFISNLDSWSHHQVNHRHHSLQWNTQSWKDTDKPFSFSYWHIIVQSLCNPHILCHHLDFSDKQIFLSHDPCL